MNTSEQMILLADSALNTWAEWMRAPSHLAALQYPAKAAGFVTGGINCWDDLEESTESVLAQGVGQIVEELPLIQKSAIYHHYLACVFRAREGVFEAALEDGRVSVARMMIGKGLA